MVATRRLYLAHLAVQQIGPAFAFAENDALPGLFPMHQPEQQLKFLVRIDGEVELANIVDGDPVRRQVDVDRFVHVALGQPQNRGRHRGGQQQRLPFGRALAQNAFDVGPKTDVEHAVGFIEDDIANPAQLQGAARQVIEHAAGRADGDAEARTHGGELLMKALAAINRHRLAMAVGNELACLLTYLDNELAGWSQHQWPAAPVRSCHARNSGTAAERPPFSRFPSGPDR